MNGEATWPTMRVPRANRERYRAPTVTSGAGAQLAGMGAFQDAPYSRKQVRDRSLDSALGHWARKAWEHRFRLVIFSVNGINVFAVGLLIQVILVRYANMGHVP